MGVTGAAVVGALVTAVATTVLAPKPKTPQIAAAPALTPVTGMPDPDGQAAAQKLSVAEQTATRGRASTILTGSAGSDTKLGA